MGWHYKDIRTFPARFPASIREAVANLNEPILFNTFPSIDAAEQAAATHRWFRWCLREKPGMDKALGHAAEIYQFRLKIEDSPGVVFLWLTARPTKLSELIALNPDLGPIVHAECQ